jgi:hypothetical protein
MLVMPLAMNRGNQFALGGCLFLPILPGFRDAAGQATSAQVDQITKVAADGLKTVLGASIGSLTTASRDGRGNDDSHRK